MRPWLLGATVAVFTPPLHLLFYSPPLSFAAAPSILFSSVCFSSPPCRAAAAGSAAQQLGASLAIVSGQQSSSLQQSSPPRRVHTLVSETLAAGRYRCCIYPAAAPSILFSSVISTISYPPPLHHPFVSETLAAGRYRCCTFDSILLRYHSPLHLLFYSPPCASHSRRAVQQQQGQQPSSWAPAWPSSLGSSPAACSSHHPPRRVHTLVSETLAAGRYVLFWLLAAGSWLLAVHWDYL